MQRGRDGLCDFVLQVEQVRRLPIVALRSEMIPALGVDELRGDADT
jgi:hypothetical protein